ncbi:flavodoxin [Catenisphaera adipataccumulans]|jgi:flavodoxin|uniref:Flavodoxin n=1 Tax=Catenisphaera adipataccumulans TaxID=700500 RepID=A0A7W8FVR2_9FIRM|nr:flavodoxin [Catenisphaera adipataccumulans]MBB5182486.1 flavodoxin [Catenisphaera adipataccumulans]
MKTLVVYYSQSGNTKDLADMISHAAGADLCRIEPAEAYASDEKKMIKQVQEQIERKEDPAYKSVDYNVKDYDAILIGTPNWGGCIALPLATFIKDQDWQGKMVLPFLSHGGAGEQKIQAQLEELCAGADVKPCFAAYEKISEDDTEAVFDWVHTYID